MNLAISDGKPSREEGGDGRHLGEEKVRNLFPGL